MLLLFLRGLQIGSKLRVFLIEYNVTSVSHKMVFLKAPAEVSPQVERDWALRLLWHAVVLLHHRLHSLCCLLQVVVWHLHANQHIRQCEQHRYLTENRDTSLSGIQGSRLGCQFEQSAEEEAQHSEVPPSLELALELAEGSFQTHLLICCVMQLAMLCDSQTDGR